ncbi:hypothetical protein AGMMS49992_22370 [Clostridia bacterium]|nr:hypothetical protein AGMMS49992_22370 [Clostridia bacterium]
MPDSTELLSPAGDRASLLAALAGGADAVYLGYSQFSARASAANFDTDELREAVELCRERGKRVYVAVNTLIAPDEMDKAVHLLHELARLGADAVILQDLGLLSRARAECSSLTLHASTQMTIHNRAGAVWAKRSGISRIIAARECGLDNYRAMAEVMEVEAFVHGALCVSVSGQCLFSSMIGCRSGNRGQCAQPCRLPYSWMDQRGVRIDGALLSPYDQAQLDNLEELLNAGICAFKIEGRMKKPAYVYHVTKAYRQALDRLASGDHPKADAETWDVLRKVFDRGGFSRGHVGGDEDAALICSQTTDHDCVYSRLDKALDDEAANATLPRVHISMRLTARSGMKAALYVTDGVRTVAVESLVLLERLTSAPLSNKRIEEQLRKTGDTAYVVDSVTTYVSDAHLPLSLLNRLRTDALDKLRLERLKRTASHDGGVAVSILPMDDLPEAVETSLIVRAREAADASSLLAAGADVFEWMPHDLRSDTLDRAALSLSSDKLPSDKVRFVMPEFISDDALEAAADWVRSHAHRFGGVVVSNPGQLVVDWGLPIHADAAIHTFNPDAAKLLFDNGCQSVTLSTELTNAQMHKFPRLGGRFVVNAYGRERLMLLSHCPARLARGYTAGHSACELCDHGAGADGTSLTDRTGAAFPLVRLRTEAECRLRILNCVPTDMTSAGCFALGTSLRLTFWDEPTDRRVKIAQRFRGILAGNSHPVKPDYAYTTGHARRNV